MRAARFLAAAMAIAAGAGLVTWSIHGLSDLSSPPPQSAAPAWHNITATPVPTLVASESNRVIAPSAPLRLEIPSISFDSSKLAGGTSNPIQQWTDAMNRAHDGQVDPPDPWDTTLVWDSTVAGGGMFGTGTQTNGRILGHTTPWNWSRLGAFNHLQDVREGDPVAITTANGRLCYNVMKSETITKQRLNVVHDKQTVVPGIVYLITCNRPRDQNNGPTTQNLVVTLELNQPQTNAQSC